jgi:hypothetical protein
VSAYDWVRVVGDICVICLLAPRLVRDVAYLVGEIKQWRRR